MENYNNLFPIALVGVATFIIFMVASRLYQFMQQKKYRSKFLKKFDGPPGKWFAGHIGDITLDQAMLDKFVRWTSTYGGVTKLEAFGNDMVLIGEPDSTAAVMKTPGPKDKVAYSLLAQWIGQGILTSDGPHWFRNRRLLTPAFHFEVLKPYTEVFNETAATLVKKWKTLCGGKQGTFEMFEHFSLMTLDSLLKTAFSTDIDCQKLGEHHPYIKAVYQLSQATMDRMNSFFIRNDFIFYNLTSQGHATTKSLQVAKDFSKDIIRRRREEKKERQGAKSGKYRDFVDMLLDAKDEDGQGLTDEEILDEVDTFMFAGHDTTASGLSWFMYNMAKYPEHQERCREEIKEVLAGRNTVVWSDLPKLEYLTMCIKESLRTHGPVVSVSRYLTEDLEFPDGRLVPAGTYAWLFLYAVHHNPDVWENPEEYDPYRFSPENSQGRHSHAFVPFSAGPRNCIGQHFALNELKIVVAQVLKSFQVEVDPDRIPRRNVSLILRAEDGVWLKLNPL